MHRHLASIALLLTACSTATTTDVDASITVDGSSDAGTTGCAQADDFLDVSTGSAGSAYAAPSLSVSCTGDQVLVVTNGIPNFEFVPVTPNALNVVTQTMRFPRVPAPAATETAVPLMGASAVAVNGLPIFGPTEAMRDGYRDPLLDGILDYCNGHTAPGGQYHFHARPDCLFTDLEGNTSLVVAYAFDGYPVLAPFVCEDDTCTSTRELESSWQRVASQFDAAGDPVYSGTTEGSWDVFEYVEGSGDLDRCNGRELPDGGYAYYATDTFPYFMGCYHGTPTSNGMRP
jgi:hypothetical protein